MSPTQTEPKPPAADAPPAMFIRMAAVVRMTGLGRSTIYRLMAEDKFPSPVRLAKRAVAWRRLDLDLWSAGRPGTRQATPAWTASTKRRSTTSTPAPCPTARS
jgi:prophage regulatory protein